MRSFIGSGENEIIEFKGDAGRIAIFDCNFGLYGDLWIASRAQFLVENIETLQLKVFLPPAAGSRDKKLSVIVNGEAVGQPASLSRGVVQEIAIGLDDRNSEATLELISEYPEDVGSADQRLLGFILSEYSVENGVWEAAKELVE